ncbi:MAG: TIGR04282 family arsenosugar biosynthesis glycosyltransferase [Hyphomicrobium sp.]|nr:TIGR04282 family arsenosugar biosynthesis glycosyltransferase [Hyphomicrobium sp.]
MATDTRSCRLAKLGTLHSGDRAFAPRLVIMVKDPRAGRVKTRLAADIGAAAATAVYRTMMTCLVSRLSRDRRWTTLLSVSPDAALSSRMLPARAGRISQGGGDLGARLHRVFEMAAAGPVVVIGSDSPAIVPDDIAEAFRILRGCDTVFGPSHDGGYWLVGMRRRPRLPQAFTNVRWSTPHALADTKRNLRGLNVLETRVHGDVDDGRDLASMRALIGRRIVGGVLHG